MGLERRYRFHNEPWDVLYKPTKDHQIWIKGGPSVSLSVSPLPFLKNECKSIGKCEALQLRPQVVKRVQPGLKMILTRSFTMGEKAISGRQLGVLWWANYCTRFIKGVNGRGGGGTLICLQRASLESKGNTLYWAYRRHPWAYSVISVVFLRP